jgi:hypothetical protein
MKPLITNERGRREWLWIVSRVGERAALAAIAGLPGQSKAFPLNIAKALRLELPAEHDLPQTPENVDAARRAGECELANMKKMLKF